ncbi:MAG TPA: DNA-directed RNA polymerase subunit K [Candidatus Thermoplasmatota archaeon]|nr:DNA-directed RNA polymerase subunit K [Candidatus Thermoplasmatota archaeon]
MVTYNRFERARIIGARALQIAMGAPILIDMDNLIDPVRVAEAEFREGVIPITVGRDDRRTVQV